MLLVSLTQDSMIRSQRVLIENIFSSKNGLKRCQKYETNSLRIIIQFIIHCSHQPTVNSGKQRNLQIIH